MVRRDEEDETFETDRSAWIAFQSSAIAGFKPQKDKYKSAEEYAEEVGEFSEAVAANAFARYKQAEKDGFPAEELEDDDDDDDDDNEEEEERPRRRRRA